MPKINVDFFWQVIGLNGKNFFGKKKPAKRRSFYWLNCFILINYAIKAVFYYLPEAPMKKRDHRIPPLGPLRLPPFKDNQTNNGFPTI